MLGNQCFWCLRHLRCAVAVSVGFSLTPLSLLRLSPMRWECCTWGPRRLMHSLQLREEIDGERTYTPPPNVLLCTEQGWTTLRAHVGPLKEISGRKLRHVSCSFITIKQWLPIKWLTLICRSIYTWGNDLIFFVDWPLDGSKSRSNLNPVGHIVSPH